MAAKPWAEPRLVVLTATVRRGSQARAVQPCTRCEFSTFLRVGRGPGRGHRCHSSLDLPGEDGLEALKAKNIKQTGLVADLREAILCLARHFQCTDPRNCSVVSPGLPGLSPRSVWGLSFPSPCRGGKEGVQVDEGSQAEAPPSW